MKKYLPIVAVVGALFFAVVGFLAGKGVLTKGYSAVNLSGKNQISSDILLLTQPVTNFSGKVDKIEGNAILVSQQFSQAQPVMAAPPVTTPGQPPPAIPTPLPPKTISYKFVINVTTQISRPPVFISYLLTTPTPPAVEKLTIKDIKPGQYVTLNTNSDLRTLAGTEVTAASIQLPQIPNSINGKISNISGSTLSVKAFAPNQNGPGMAGAGVANATIAPPKELTYTVSVTDSTEISRYGQVEPPKDGSMPKGPVVEKLSLSDLKVDMQLTVFTDVDVSAVQKFTARRIEPTIIIAPPPVVQVPPVNVSPPITAVTPNVSTPEAIVTTAPAVSPKSSNETTNLVPQKVNYAR